MRLCEGRLEIVADALADLSGEVPPSSEAVLPREDQLGITQGDGLLSRDLLGLFTKEFQRRTGRKGSRSRHHDLLS